MATDKLRVTELDFDTIKTNLKNFFADQTEFTDYDFSGSGLSILLDVLAYNTHYMAYYLNMVAYEMYLDSATQRDSVVSLAKQLGYNTWQEVVNKANNKIIMLRVLKKFLLFKKLEE